jgi:hypothetical protein
MSNHDHEIQDPEIQNFEIAYKSVVLEHSIIILLFVIFGILFLSPVLLKIVSQPYSDILLSLSTSLFVSALITVSYDVILTKDTGKMIASYLILDKKAVDEVLNPSEYNKIVLQVLQNYLGDDMGKLVKHNVVDRIRKTHSFSDELEDHSIGGKIINQIKGRQSQLFLISSHDTVIVLKNDEKRPNFYKLIMKESYFQNVYSRKIIFSAVCGDKVWYEKLRDKRNLYKGVLLVWRIHPDLKDDLIKLNDKKKNNLDIRREEYSDIFDVKFSLGSTLLEPESTKFYEEDDCYVIDIIYDTSKYYNQSSIEYNYEYNTIKYKFDHHFYYQTDFAFKNISVEWDSRETDIKKIIFRTSIESEHIYDHGDPTNKLLTIKSYYDGLPGNYIFFLWSLN